MSQQRLTNVYNRQVRLDHQEQSVHQLSLLNESAHRLIKLPSAHVLQSGIFALIEPLLFWLEYSIRTRDKISLFKQVWLVLRAIIHQCAPHKLLKINIIMIIFPHL